MGKLGTLIFGIMLGAFFTIALIKFPAETKQLITQTIAWAKTVFHSLTNSIA